MAQGMSMLNSNSTAQGKCVKQYILFFQGHRAYKQKGADTGTHKHTWCF